MASYPNQLNPGAYIGQTQPIDPYIVNALPLDDATKSLLINIGRSLNDIALMLNIKESAYYPLEEFVTGKVYFPNPSLSSSTSRYPVFRNDFRKVINFGTLPNNSTTSVTHGIPVDSQYTFTRMYGCSSIPGSSFVAIPNSDIKLTANATNVTIITTSSYVGYTNTYVVLEYMKS